jgi:uncharacterized protein
MKPSDALRTYRSEIRDIVARHGALAPRVFGSAVNGTDTEESDLDFLVDPSPRTTLMTLAAIQLDAEHLLGVHVDFLPRTAFPNDTEIEYCLRLYPYECQIGWHNMAMVNHGPQKPREY